MKKEYKRLLFFGSARRHLDKDERRQFYLFLKEFNVQAVITGGGSGSMDDANIIANANDVLSLGVTTYKLRHSEGSNNHMTEFKTVEPTMFDRKKSYFQKVNVVYVGKGGIGTLDELFETLTLIQIEDIHPIPDIILTDIEFHKSLLQVVFKELEKQGTISSEEIDRLKSHIFLLNVNSKGKLCLTNMK